METVLGCPNARISSSLCHGDKEALETPCPKLLNTIICSECEAVSLKWIHPPRDGEGTMLDRFLKSVAFICLLVFVLIMNLTYEKRLLFAYFLFVITRYLPISLRLLFVYFRFVNKSKHFLIFIIAVVRNRIHES